VGRPEARYTVRMSEWSPHKRAGFALAALLNDDRSLSRVRAHVAEAEAARAETLLDPRSEPDKTRLVTHLLSLVRPALTQLPKALPVRLTAVLASKLPRSRAADPSRGERGASIARNTRDGYAPAPDLLPRLLRIARRSIDEEDQSS